MTGLNHRDFGGRFCLELSPQAYDNFFTELQAIVTAPGASTPPINERAWWATLAFDIDYERNEDEDVGRCRHAHVCELARLFAQELEMHFTGFAHASAIVCVSVANRFRLYFPGVPYIGMVAVYKLLHLVKEKAYADIDLRECLEVLDEGPTKQRHLRVHGTIGVDNEGNDKPSGRYRVCCVVPDSSGYAPPTHRLSIRPDTAAYEKMLRDPENAYLRCCSDFVRQPRHNREDDSYWMVDLLEMLFDVDPIETESEDSIFDESEEERVEPIALLISPLLVVAEYKDDRCLLTLHGYRADTGTAHYLDGSVCIITGLNAVQLPEPVNQNDPSLLTGVVASPFTELLRQPQVVDMSSFPVSLFCYSRGVTPVTPVYDSEENTLEYVFRGASATRQVTHDGGEASTQSLVELLVKSCSIELERFSVSSDSNVISNRDIARFSDAFSVDDVFSKRNVDTEVTEIVAGCGVGKTVFALKVIDRLKHRPRFSVLVVTPRAQLCTQLAVKLHDATGLATHIYTDGEWPASSPACVVTLDSLVKCVAERGVSRRPTLVLLDEIELTARHVATSETLSSSVSQRLRTLETLLVLLANARYIIAMDAHFGYAASMLLAMAALRSGKMAPDRSMHFTRLKLVDNRVRQQYCVLADDYRRFVRIRDSLIEGRNVIVFESSPRKAQALMSLLEAYVQAPATALLVHGKSDAELKRMFSSNPSEYLRVNKVQLFIHTSSVGVGVSIDEPHFHEAHVAFRPHMSDEAAVQASHRARHLESSQLIEPEDVEGEEPRVPHVVREVFVRFDERMRFAERGLATIRTVGDAVSTFERRLSMSREFYRKYADFARISEFDARVTASLKDPNTLFVAALLAASEMSVNHQGIFTVMRVFDDAVSMRFEGTRSSDDELRMIREAERAVEFDLSVLPTDAPRTMAQKTRLARSIGYEFDEGLHSKAFQGRLAFGMSHPSNLRRFTALLVLMLVDEPALSLHMQRVLENVTETMPLYAHDDARGVTVGVEAIAAYACLRAFGIETAQQFSSPQVLVRSPDWGTRVTNFTGAETDFDELFETIMRRFRGPRWAKCWRNKTNCSKARRFLNSFFTNMGESVINSRTMAWDARQVRLSAELVPGYCHVHSIDMPQVVLDWCAQFNGTWSQFIDDEKNGVHQQPIY